MDDGPRWLVAIVVAIAIAALVAFARGEPEHGEPPPAAAAVISVLE